MTHLAPYDDGYRPRPVITWASVLAALQIIAGGAAFTDLIGPRWAALALLVLAAVQVAVGLRVQGQVTPLDDPRDNNGTPLVPAPTGSTPTEGATP